jgi:hypothetical protein
MYGAYVTTHSLSAANSSHVIPPTRSSRDRRSSGAVHVCIRAWPNSKQAQREAKKMTAADLVYICVFIYLYLYTSAYINIHKYLKYIHMYV